MEACAPAPLLWAGRLRGLNSPSSSVAATRCRGSQGRLGLVAGTSVPARTGPAPTGPWRRSLPGGRELSGERPLAAFSSVGHPPDPS